MNSCLTFAVMQDGRAITTIEGIGTDGALHPLQAAFIRNDGFQCGYCTPGQICSAVALIAEGHTRVALGGVGTKPWRAHIRSIDVILVEEDDPFVNPVGVKGVGEIGIVGVSAAIANAVFHATGKRVRDLPITIDKLL
jgi:hypothetical protein